MVSSLNTWMNVPSLVIPEERKASQNANETSLTYERLFHAFSRSLQEVKDDLVIPRACKLSREGLAAAAIKPLLHDRFEGASPDILIDCCSSAAIGGPAPTYKLAASCGITKLLPFALDGQAGAEVAHALLFLQYTPSEIGRRAIISAVQRVESPDSRLRKKGFPLADAAAAVDCSSIPFAGRFRVLGIALGQLTGDWRGAVDSLLIDVLRKTKIDAQDICWSVAHRCCEPFLWAAQNALPQAKWMVRDLYPELDFGCVDTLVSLNRLFSDPARDSAGFGILWFVGRFGSIASVLVEHGSDG